MHLLVRLTLISCICTVMPLGCVGADRSDEVARQGTGDTLRVAYPTGVIDFDRANVQAVFDSVRSGDTVLFEAGMYLLGGGVYLRVPDVAVLGHPGATVLRGCAPEAFDIDEAEFLSLVMGCSGFFVQAERQTIRGLTFEYAWHGIVVGPYPATVEEAAATQGMMPPYPAGGQRIEGNTFRATPNGMRILGVGDEVSVIRDNDFIDNFHAIGIYGPPVRFLENRVTVEDPVRVPTSRHPGSAILVSAAHTDCAGHEVADNTVEGYPGAIYVVAAPGEVCRDVEIRNNVIRVGPVNVPAGTWVIPTSDDSTLVGVPITISSRSYSPPGETVELADGVVEHILVEGNQVLGADGLGILVNGSDNRIVNNVVRDIRRRRPFPGVNWDPSLVTWEKGNGSGIWVGPNGQENEIAGNVFDKLAGPAVTLEGDRNLVTVADDADTVMDLGEDNRVTNR